jgi:hypothetical protein
MRHTQIFLRCMHPKLETARKETRNRLGQDGKFQQRQISEAGPPEVEAGSGPT